MDIYLLKFLAQVIYLLTFQYDNLLEEIFNVTKSTNNFYLLTLTFFSQVFDIQSRNSLLVVQNELLFKIEMALS